MTPLETFQLQKWQAIEAYQAQRNPLAFFQAHTQAADAWIASVWAAHFANGGLCLLAIGGYGRGELYPYSDVDLAVVAADEPDAAAQENIARFVQALWDGALKPAVKTGSLQQLLQAAEEDLTADTAFLEARFLCGDRALAEQAVNALNVRRDTVSFMDGKLLEMQQRHDKYAGFPLEPDIKNGAGCLRDIHTMLWLARAQGLHTDFYALARDKIITRMEAGLLRSSHRRLAQIRIELHLTAGREENRLIFDLQGTLAENRDLCRPDKQTGIEHLMRDFYRTAKTVMQLNGILIPMLRERVSLPYPRIVHDLDAHYFQIGNKIAAKDLLLFQKQPAHLFILLQMWQQHSDVNGVAPKTLRAWWAAARKTDGAFYRNERHRALFLQFFKTGKGLTHIMRFLNLYGLLAKYLPNWYKIVGLLQHDLFHIYPVDDHILTVLGNMRRLAMEEHSHELPFAATLMHDFPQPHLLYLAALFHDIAKGRNGDHARLGRADARQFAEDHALPEADGELVEWLVGEHLLMAATAQKEDIHDPDVVRRFAEKVQTPERLAALYLLTVADIRGTNPKLWTAWKAQLLQTLYRSTHAYLAGSLHTVLPENRQQNAHNALKAQGADDKTIRRLFAMLGEAYFARFPAETATWQLGILVRDPEAACFDIRPGDAEGSLQLFVYMPDRDRLFSELCELFATLRLDIATARIFTTEHQYALNSFVLGLPEHSNEADREHAESSLHRAMTQFMDGRWQSKAPSAAKPSRRARWNPIAPHIGITETEGGQFSIEVVAANRPYLLADLSRIFSRHRIHLQYAKISTLIDRAEDVFIVHAPQLHEAAAQRLLRQDLQAACTGHLL